MQDTLRALLAIQDLDKTLFRVREELRRLPEERQARRAQLDALIERRQGLEEEVRELRSRVKEIEDHTTIQRQRQRKVENEANNSRGDVALMVAFQHESRSLKRDIGIAEEEGLRLLEKTEGIEQQCQELQAQIDESEEVFKAFSQNAARETAVAEARRREMETERENRLGSGLETDVLELYNRLLVARDGIAMAELDGRICQECFMEVPTNSYVRVARGLDVIQCPSCDRILFHRG